MTINAIEFRTNKELQRFADEGDSFCHVVEKHEEYSVYEFVCEMDQRLASLYALARRLPDLILENDVEDELEAERDSLSDSVPIIECDKYVEQLNERLKPRSRYRFVFDPIVGEEPVESGFGEDIGSVYGDLKGPWHIFKKGSEAAAQQAAWDWKFGLFHWGRHALNVLAFTHSIISWHYDTDGEPWEQ